VDLRLIPGAVPSDAEREAIDALLGPPSGVWDGTILSMTREGYAGPTGHELRGQRHLLLPALHAAQATTGYISPGGLNYICQRLNVPPAEAYGVASFYALFALDPRPPVVAHVCDDIACRCRGALELCADLERELGPANSPALDGAVTWTTSPCLGRCEAAPVVLVQRAGGGEPLPQPPPPRGEGALDTNGLKPLPSQAGYPQGGGWGGVRDTTLVNTDAQAVITALQSPPQPLPEPSLNGDPSVPQSLEPDNSLRLLRRVGRVDPTSIDAYRASGGYEALRQAFRIGPAGVIREVQESRLLGRGGAAFPAGRKLEDVARAPVRPHYLICNADESEPGTFKDRALMEGDPFALIEAMTTAGYAAGCERGFLYIRGEYPVATARIANAIDEARLRGFLGENIMDEGFDFEIELRIGAGAYICGEETALFNSIEGYRGEPRNKPPFPTQAGLFGVPTLVNNVETLVNFPDIILEGGVAYASIGTEGSTGPKLFCLSGAVERPGIYEAPFGITLRALLEMAGGVPGGRPIQAILLGGAAGTFITPDEIDVPLTFEGTRAIGGSLGSGVIMVFDDTADMPDILLRIAAFFRDESCGQCVPCRVGTVRQQEALRRLVSGKPLQSVDGELQLIDDVGLVMRDASICGLGQTAANAIQSAITKLQLFQNGNRV
jgi:NADH-quinone oxidoreductase subunit F